MALVFVAHSAPRTAIPRMTAICSVRLMRDFMANGRQRGKRSQGWRNSPAAGELRRRCGRSKARAAGEAAPERRLTVFASGSFEMDPLPFRPRRQALNAGDLTALRADPGPEPNPTRTGAAML